MLPGLVTTVVVPPDCGRSLGHALGHSNASRTQRRTVCLAPARVQVSLALTALQLPAAALRQLGTISVQPALAKPSICCVTRTTAASTACPGFSAVPVHSLAGGTSDNSVVASFVLLSSDRGVCVRSPCQCLCEASRSNYKQEPASESPAFAGELQHNAAQLQCTVQRQFSFGRENPRTLDDHPAAALSVHNLSC